MDQETENPFKPNWGITPPHRAGHEGAESDLSRMLNTIGKGKPVGGAILYGPRGTGKTVLLKEFSQKAMKAGVRVSELNTGDMTGKPKELGEMLMPPRWLDRLSITGLTAILPFGGGAGVKFRGSAAKSVERTLRLLLRKPLVLIVDEAHEMPPDFAKALLQAAQRCIRDDLPLLVLLAGTPAIEENLSRAHASFWERSHLLRIGRLESEDATRAALSLPAEREGLPFAPDALERLVTESQGYPYFIQLVGMWAWEAAIARDPGADRILLEDAEASVRMANPARSAFYWRRLQEVERRGVLSEARAVSRAFFAIGGDGALPTTKLETELKPALTGNRTVLAALRELLAVGLIWQTDDHAFWEPGIPSLCTYIAEYAPTD